MPSNSLSLSLVLSSEPALVGKWQYEKTRLLGIAPASGTESGHEILSATKNNQRTVLWRGLKLNLDKESAESYWANVSGNTPQLFVACRKENDEVVPVCVTASGEEAAGYSEVDDEILSLPMPNWIIDTIERFVITYYRPRQKKVRKRK